MATTPTTSTITTDVTEAKTFLQKHERLIVTTLVLAAAIFIGNKFLNLSAARDQRAATAASATLQAQQDTNKQLAAQIAQTVADYKTLVVQLTQQNTQLQQQVNTRTVVLQQQVATDKTLPLPDLGKRWAQLANIKPSDISATSTGITVTPAGALTTLIALEQVPVLNANLSDVSAQKANLQTELTASNTLTAEQASEITGLNTAAGEQDKSCKAQIASAKADARKGKLKSFGIGVGVGVGVVVAFVVAHAL